MQHRKRNKLLSKLKSQVMFNAKKDCHLFPRFFLFPLSCRPVPPKHPNVAAEKEMSLACIVHNGGGVGGSPRYTFE